MCCPPAWMWNRWLSEWMAGVGGLVPGELILMLESVGAASTGGSPCLLILFSCRHFELSFMPRTGLGALSYLSLWCPLQIQPLPGGGGPISGPSWWRGPSAFSPVNDVIVSLLYPLTQLLVALTIQSCAKGAGWMGAMLVGRHRKRGREKAGSHHSLDEFSSLLATCAVRILSEMEGGGRRKAEALS